MLEFLEAALEVVLWLTTPVRWISVVILGDGFGALVGGLLTVIILIALARLLFEGFMWLLGAAIGLSISGFLFALQLLLAILVSVIQDAWEVFTGRHRRYRRSAGGAFTEEPPASGSSCESDQSSDEDSCILLFADLPDAPLHPLEVEFQNDPWWAVLRDEARGPTARKAAWRRLCKAYHPDKVGGDQVCQDAAKRCFQQFDGYFREVVSAQKQL